jgi:hypothetical protein
LRQITSNVLETFYDILQQMFLNLFLRLLTTDFLERHLSFTLKQISVQGKPFCGQIIF